MKKKKFPLLLFFSLAILYLSIGKLNVYAAIPSDAIEWNDHYYKVFRTKMTPADANAYCKSLGGYLATLTSSAEKAVVVNAINTYGDHSNYLLNTRRYTDTDYIWGTGEESINVFYPSTGTADYDKYAYLGWYEANNYPAQWGGEHTTLDSTNTYYFVCEWGDQIDISKAELTLDYEYYTFMGLGHEPKIKLTYKDVTLEANVDYYYEYFDNVYPGYGRIEIHGWGRFCGKRIDTFLIKESTIQSEAVLNQIIDYEGGTPPADAYRWNGHYYKRFDTEMTYQQAYDFCISQGGYLATITSGWEFTFISQLISNKSNINKSKKFLINRTTGDGSGTYTWGNGEKSTYSCWTYSNKYTGTYDNVIEWWAKNTNYNEQWVFTTIRPSGTYPFICEWGDPIPMTETVCEMNNTSYGYAEDTEHKPSMNLYSDGILLAKNLDYTVSYRNNIEIGRGEIVLTGTGRYTGEKIIYFDICPRTVLNLKAESTGHRELHLTWTTRDKVDGYQIQYSKTIDFAEYIEKTVEGQNASEYTSAPLERGTTYYARVRAYKKVGADTIVGEWVTVNTKTGNQILVDEMWGFKNPEAEIDIKYYNNLFKPATALTLYKNDGGVPVRNGNSYSFPDVTAYGLCHGIVITGVAAYTEDTPEDLYSIREHSGMDSIKNVKTYNSTATLWSDDINMSAQDAIIYAYLLQKDPVMGGYKESTHNNLYGLYCAVKDCQSGKSTPPVMITIVENNKAHQLLAVCIAEEGEEQVKIEVYDCNYPTEERFLYLMKTDGNFTAWSYLMEITKENQYVFWASQVNTADHYYDEEDDDDNNDMLVFDLSGVSYVANKFKAGMEEKSLGYLARFYPIYKTEETIKIWNEWLKKNSDEIGTRIVNTQDNGNVEVYSALYSVNTNYIKLQDVPSGIGIDFAHDHHVVTAEVTQTSDIEIKAGSTNDNYLKITSDNNGDFTVVFRDYMPDSNGVTETIVKGTSETGQQATVKQTFSQDIQLKGVVSAEYERINGNTDKETGNIVNVNSKAVEIPNLSKDKYYQVTTENGKVVVSGSSSANGNYKESVMIIEKKDESNHKFSSWKTTVKADVFNDEKQSRTCGICNYTETKTVKGTKLKPTIKVTANTVPLKIKQSTTGFKVTGLARGDSIVSMKLNSTKYVKLSRVKLAKGTCKLTAKKKKGIAKLTIKLASGLEKVVKIKVQTTAVKTKKITGVSKKLTLKKGKTHKLQPSLVPFTSKDKIKYTSSNKKVVNVSTKGVLKALKKGKVKITVKAGKKKFICNVTVK